MPSAGVHGRPEPDLLGGELVDRDAGDFRLLGMLALGAEQVAAAGRLVGGDRVLAVIGREVADHEDLVLDRFERLQGRGQFLQVARVRRPPVGHWTPLGT
jgi:hypothetical protein